MSYELGVAYISVLPSMRDFKKRMEGELGTIIPNAGKDQGSKMGKGMLSGVSGAVKKWGKRTLVGAAAAAGGFAATALTTGFQRSVKIENAQATLKGLGYNEKDIKGIMDEALSAVSGTAFGLDQAVTISSGALAAGVKDLEGYLKSVGDVATITGRDMGEIGSIFNKVMANGRLSAQEMNQLADSGIPVLQLLQDEYGVTADEARKMVSKGEVDSETFVNLMKTYEGAALESGNTTQGSFANMKAAISRLGQAALEEIFPHFKTGFQGATKFVDEMTKKVKEHLPTVIEWIKKTGGQIKDKLQPTVEAISAFFTGTAVPAFQKFVDEFKNGEGAGGKVKEALKTLKTTLESVFNYITNTAIPAIKDIVMWFKDHKGVALALVAAYGALRAAMIAHAAAQAVAKAGGMVQYFKNLIMQTNIAKAAQKAWNAVIWLTHGAQKALNLVMKMNPIGLIIIAITALVGILFIAYKRHEGFRNLVNKVWASIKEAAGKVVNWFRDTAWPTLKNVFAKIGDVAKFLWNNIYKPYFTLIWNIWKNVFFWLRDTAWPVAKDIFNKVAGAATNLYNNGIKPAFNKIKDIVSNVWDSIKGTFDKFKKGIASIKDAFSRAKDGIADVWRKLTNAIARPINAVIDKVNKFLTNLKNGLNKIPGVDLTGNWTIRKIILDTSKATVGRQAYGAAQALASGGKVGGFSPHDRADNIPAWLTAGEYVLPVKATERLRAAIGDGGLEALRRGSLPGYADGGLIGTPKWLKGKIRGFAEVFGNSWPGQVAKGVVNNFNPRAILDKIMSSISRVIGGQKVNYGGAYGWAPNGMGWQSIWQRIKAVAPESVMTSNYRPGAITASGVPSLHGQGRAVDIVSSDMRATFNKIKNLLPWSQLFYTPMGGQQIGYRDSIIARTHWDHIHAAFADGGLVPRLYDDGGAILPGLSLVANKTRQPEMVLTNDQWTDIREGNGGNVIHIHGVDVESAPEVADELLFALKRTGRGKYNRSR